MREAVVTVSDREFAELGIEELVSLCQSAGIEDFEELVCHWDGAVIQVELADPLDEQRLRDLPYVDRCELVSEGETHLYVIGFTAPALSAEVSDHGEEMVDCDPELTDEGAQISLVGPQEAIRKMLGEYEEAGASPDLRKLGAYEGSEGPLDDLTDRQVEVVETAYAMGYYEVPRQASTDEVAAELDLDSSTVAEHLQRAERNLLTRHLSTAL